MKDFNEQHAPNTPNGCWCMSYEEMWRRYRYWHRAFCISMFFHGAISIPIVIAAAIEAIAQVLA